VQHLLATSYDHQNSTKHDSSIHQTQNLENAFTPTVLFYLALVVSSTLAKFPLPKGYHITSLTDFGTEANSESRDNPHSPLLNATLTCYKDNHATLLWRNYELSRSGWYGVSEKAFKHAAANANACMTRWKFKTWKVTDCFRNEDGTDECFENLPVWRATVSLSEPWAYGRPSNAGT
jgi:hypothetical protein